MSAAIALCSRLFVVFIVALAMTGSSFAHRAVPAQLDDGMAAYVAAGGSLADLCGDPEFGGGGEETCDACRLVDGATVPQGAGTVVAAQTLVLCDRLVFASTAPVPAIADPARPVRAPPFV